MFCCYSVQHSVPSSFYAAVWKGWVDDSDGGGTGAGGGCRFVYSVTEGLTKVTHGTIPMNARMKHVIPPPPPPTALLKIYIIATCHRMQQSV